MERLRGILCQLPPTGDIEEGDLLLPFVGLAVLPATIDGDTEVCGGLSRSRETQLRITGDVSDDGDGVVDVGIVGSFVVIALPYLLKSSEKKANPDKCQILLLLLLLL